MSVEKDNILYPASQTCLGRLRSQKWQTLRCSWQTMLWSSILGRWHCSTWAVYLWVKWHPRWVKVLSGDGTYFVSPPLCHQYCKSLSHGIQGHSSAFNGYMVWKMCRHPSCHHVRYETCSADLRMLLCVAEHWHAPYVIQSETHLSSDMSW